MVIVVVCRDAMHCVSTSHRNHHNLIPTGLYKKGFNMGNRFGLLTRNALRLLRLFKEYSDI